MELFKLSKSTFKPTTSIQNYNKVIWTERYREHDEFSLEMDLTKKIYDELTLESVIGTNQTNDMLTSSDRIYTGPMLLENLEIVGPKDKRIIIFSGRSFETILEQRYRGLQLMYDSTNDPVNLFIEDTPAEIAVSFIREGVDGSYATIADRVIPNVYGITTIVWDAEDKVYFEISREKSYYEQMIEALNMADLGVKAFRIQPSDSNQDHEIHIHVYEGLDKRDSVIFHEHNNELVDSHYFKSSKSKKTIVRVNAKYHTVAVKKNTITPTPTGFDRRETFLNAPSIEDAMLIPASAKAGPLGRVKIKPETYLAESNLSNNASKKYGSDYNLGDLVLIRNEFGEEFSMRVVEYTTTWDKTSGFSYFSTLSPYEGT